MEKEERIRINLFKNYDKEDRIYHALFGFFDDEGNREGYIDFFDGDDFSEERIKKANSLLPDLKIVKILVREWSKKINPNHVVFYSERNTSLPKKIFPNKIYNGILGKDIDQGLLSMSASKWKVVYNESTDNQELTKTLLISMKGSKGKEYGFEALIFTVKKEYQVKLNKNDYWQIKTCSILGNLTLFNSLTKRYKSVNLMDDFKFMKSPIDIIKIVKKLNVGKITRKILKILRKQRLIVFENTIKKYKPVVTLSNGITLRCHSFWLEPIDLFDEKYIHLEASYKPFYKNNPFPYNDSYSKLENDWESFIKREERKFLFITEFFSLKFELFGVNFEILEILPYYTLNLYAFVIITGLKKENGEYYRFIEYSQNYDGLIERIINERACYFKEMKITREALFNYYIKGIESFAIDSENEIIEEHVNKFKILIPDKFTFRITKIRKERDFDFTINGINGRIYYDKWENRNDDDEVIYYRFELKYEEIDVSLMTVLY